MRKRLWDLAKSRIEIGTILPGHRHKVKLLRNPIAKLAVHAHRPCVCTERLKSGCSTSLFLSR